MMSNDSETVEDAKKNSLAEFTDNSFTEIVPILHSAADDYQRSECIGRVFEVDLKQEPASDTDENSQFYVKQEQAEDCVNQAPLHSTTHDCQRSEVIDRMFEVDPKQEPADDAEKDSQFYVNRELTEKCDETEISHFCVPTKVCFATKLIFAIAGLYILSTNVKLAIK